MSLTSIRLSGRHLSIRAREGQRKMKDGGKKMVANFCLDFVNPKLIPIKITFFFIMGATQCVAPYSTLLMKALGLTVKEIGIIYTVGPLIPFLAPLIAGILTDKLGNFRRFLVVTVLLSGVFSLLHIIIPPARTKITLSEEPNIKFDLTCENDTFLLSYTEPLRCETRSKMASLKYINASMCGYSCKTHAVELESHLHKSGKDIVILHSYNDSHSFSCEVGPKKMKCFDSALKDSERRNSFLVRDVALRFHKPNETTRKMTIGLKGYTMLPSDTGMFDCKIGTRTRNISVRKMFLSPLTGQESGPAKARKYVSCTFHCEGELQFESVCKSSSQTIVHNVSLSFWTFMVSKMMSSFLTGLTYSMFEAAVVAIMKQHSYDYGIQRIYGSIGGMIFAPITGFLIDYFGTGNHYSDYYIGFYLYCGIKILCAIILVKLDLNFRTPSHSVCGNFTEIFLSLETILLILVVFVSGMCYGFIEHFLPWHMKDLGADNWLIGLMTTVASVSAIPFLAASDFLCRRFGHVQCISFGLVCYAVRCFGYSLLWDPLWCFPYEVLEGVTTGLLVASAIIYGAKLSQQKSLGTLQGMLATFHYGIGKSVGSLLGGFLMETLGARFAFRSFSVGSLVIAFLYYLLLKLVLQPRRNRLDRRRREISAMAVEVIPRNEDLNIGEPALRTFEESSYPATSTPEKPERFPPTAS